MRRFLPNIGKTISLILLVAAVCGHAQAETGALKKVAKDFGKKIVQSKATSVAVLLFPYEDGRINSASSGLSEELAHYISAHKGLRVLNREDAKRILDDHHVVESAVKDVESAKRVGTLLNVEALIVGVLIDKEKERVELNSKVFHLSTGDVLTERRIFLKRTWTDAPRFPRHPSRP